ncbi:hypothetical protein FEM08_20760 [Flavobacterium gilvum]|nr:hypothetical protein FEM08_20760 [Flavobacterium gilvum]
MLILISDSSFFGCFNDRFFLNEGNASFLQKNKTVLLKSFFF